MKQKMKFWALAMVSIFTLVACGDFNFPAEFPLPTTGTPQKKALTTEEIIGGLKEALTVGAENSVGFASKVDGFYKNPLLSIPFPEEAIQVKNTLEKAGIQKPVDDFVVSLNRAAEDASKRAFPILKNAIVSMTITDALGILKGGETAATDYLREKTTTELTKEFAPVVRNSIANVNVTSYWDPIVTNYNRITFLTGGEKVNPNLEEYVTERAINGLFTLIAAEEQQIRKDPVARVTDLLRKVFAEQ